jgi:hypothetical protein
MGIVFIIYRIAAGDGIVVNRKMKLPTGSCEEMAFLS